MKALRTLTVSLSFLLIFCLVPAREAPNVILFLVDDMGLVDTSVPMLADKNGKPKRHPLNDWYRTPNINWFDGHQGHQCSRRAKRMSFLPWHRTVR